MIEIIPNWHPLAVHFPIALMATSTLFFLGGLIFKSPISKELLLASKWCLWSAGVAAIIAATFGWLAYNSVAHDTPSHAAMTIHKDWAIPTAIFIFLVACYAYIIRGVWGEKKNFLTALLLILATLLVSVTGWLGGEAVYRYGIGVMRIPNPDTHSHSNNGLNNDHNEDTDASADDHDDSEAPHAH